MNKFLLTNTSFVLFNAVVAQQNNQLTAKDYWFAESFLNHNKEPVIDYNNVKPGGLSFSLTSA